MLPFGNTVDYMELQGRYVKEMLEVGVEEYDPINMPGKLLQTSGKNCILFTYNIYSYFGHTRTDIQTPVAFYPTRKKMS